MADNLLQVHELRKVFPVKASSFSNRKLLLTAVDGVGFTIRKGETLGLVGESGCGKTTVGRTLLRLYDADGGRVFIDPDEKVVAPVLDLDRQATKLDEERAALLTGRRAGIGPRRAARELTRRARQVRRRADALASESDIHAMDATTLKRTRQRMQMVFQDPWASLNPRMLIKDLISEGPREFKTHSGKEVETLVYNLLDKVGLPTAAASRYPHEFSGGQRQRIGIARALALNPSLIVCDEPVSALDVSIQAQVLNLLIALQDEFDLTYIFIAHDLSVVQYISDRVAVMYLGRIVEIAESERIYANPRHPYTISLLSAVPVADPDVKKEEIVLEGDVPSPVNPPPGCSFHPRCPYATDICRKATPVLEPNAVGHEIACHNPPNG